MGTQLPRAGSPNVLFIFDLSCWIYRFHATVGYRAAHEFTAFVARLLRERMPSHVAVCADLPFPNFRHALYPKREVTAGPAVGYKAQREAPDAGLLERMRWAHEMLEDAFGVPVYSKRGFEADDVIASLVRAARERGMQSVVVAHDKDLLQLVDGTTSLMWDGKSKVWGLPEVLEKFGVRADQVRDYLAIVGDASDNVPGVRGLGPQAAKELLREFDTLDQALYSAQNDPKHRAWGRSPSWRAKLVASQQAAELSKKLVSLAHDAPVAFDFDAMKREDLPHE